MKLIWFKKSGWICLPVHPMGFTGTLLAIAFMIPIFIAIIRNGHSVSDGLYQIFVFGTCTAFWWKWLRGKNSE